MINLSKYDIIDMLYQLLFSIVRKESVDMGKNHKGKECEKGASQRKDSLYYASFANKYRKDTKNIFLQFRKYEIGQMKHGMQISIICSFLLT